jgi:hypothetical protein
MTAARLVRLRVARATAPLAGFALLGVIRMRMKSRFYAIGGNGGRALVAGAAHCA